jgi:hypothetical protein
MIIASIMAMAFYGISSLMKGLIWNDTA